MNKYLIILGIFGSLLTGCSREKVVEYKVAKEVSEAVVPKMPPPTAQPPMAQQTMPGLEEATEPFKTPTWTVPDSWQVQPQTAMRKGNFLIKENGMQAEVTVLAFPGDVGGKLANVNRWAGQIGMPPLSESSIESMDSIEVDGLTGTVVDLTGTQVMAGKDQIQSIKGVIVERQPGTWFFKMMGDDPVVQKHKEEFLEFVKSTQFQ